MIIRFILLLLVLLTSCKQEEQVEAPRPVKAIQAKISQEETSDVLFPGTLRAFKRADLSFRVDGILMVRDISVGQKAEQGEILLQLDPREYEIALRKAKGKVESTQAQLDFARRDFQRMENIYDTDPGAISESLLDRRKESKNKLEAELLIAESDLDQATDNLSYTSLKAPFDGIIAAIYVENHEQVRAKQPVVRFLDTAEREMEINVPEKFMNTLLEGGANLRFNVYLDAFPNRTFPASIKEIGTEASSTTQTYPITLTLKKIPIELSLLAGMSGKALLQHPESDTSQSLYKIPKSAVLTENLNNLYVWVVDPETQTVHKRAVQVEKSGNGEFAFIREGLETGDWVVIAGATFLSEGQKVKFSTEQAAP